MTDIRAESRYRVISRLATGGMAEVFHAESVSLAGFTKSVAIKRVLPNIADPEKFTEMFLDEARLCARLNHRNIVQVFDVGRSGGSYFIVMEYVDGATLRALMDHVRKRGDTVPLQLALHIAVEVCNGLEYAHRLKDGSGRRLGIVHRDISPANVLLSRAGGVKIVDFGLAKAVGQEVKTDPGMLKGKFGYIAPEVANGGEADALADVFAVGVVLWEMLAGRPLFKGANEWETVKLVRECLIPDVRVYNEKVTDALDAVLRSLLAKEKSDRVQSAGAAARELTKVLFALGEPVNAEDLAILVHEVLNVKYTARTVDVVAPRSATSTLDVETALANFEPIDLRSTMPPPDDTDSSTPSSRPPEKTPDPVPPPRATSVATAGGRPGRAAESRAPTLALAAILGVGALVGVGFVTGLIRLPRRAESATAGAQSGADQGSSATAPTDSAAAAPAQPPVAPTPGTPPSVAPGAAAQAAAPTVAATPTSDGITDLAVAPDPDGVRPDTPSVRARFALAAAINERVRACEARETVRHRRHARFFVTYEGSTGHVVEARNNAPYFADLEIGRCLDHAVRAVSAPPFTRDRWMTDYTFTIR